MHDQVREMTPSAFHRLSAGLGAVILVLIVAGVAVTADRRTDNPETQPMVATTIAGPAPTAAPTTSTPASTAPASSPSVPSSAVALPVPSAPETPVPTLTYDPVQTPSFTTPPSPPPTTGGGVGGCYASLLPLPGCDVGPYVTEPPP